MGRLTMKGLNQNMRSDHLLKYCWGLWIHIQLSLSLTFKRNFSARLHVLAGAAGAAEAGRRKQSAGKSQHFTCWGLHLLSVQNFSLPASALGLYCNHSRGKEGWSCCRHDMKSVSFLPAVGMVPESCHNALYLLLFCRLWGWPGLWKVVVLLSVCILVSEPHNAPLRDRGSLNKNIVPAGEEKVHGSSAEFSRAE